MIVIMDFASDILNELINEKTGLNLYGNYSKNGQYVVDLNDSNIYAKVYSALDKNNDLEELADSNIISETVVSISYLYSSKNAQITLNADLDNFEYNLIINVYEYGED